MHTFETQPTVQIKAGRQTQEDLRAVGGTSNQLLVAMRTNEEVLSDWSEPLTGKFSASHVHLNSLCQICDKMLSSKSFSPFWNAIWDTAV